MIRAHLFGPKEAVNSFASTFKKIAEADRQVVRKYESAALPNPVPDCDIVIVVHHDSEKP